MEKIWGLLIALSNNVQCIQPWDKVGLEDDFWNYFLDEAEKSGLNTILLDVGDGVQYKSYPEICLPDAWSYEKVHKELEKCRAKGIRIIPKVNFSSGHNYWMKGYRRMTSTPKYYEFCSAIIQEIYEIFEHPEYIHLGMDEEYFFEDRIQEDIAIIRRPPLFAHDLKFLLDEVKKTGARPIIWADFLLDHTEEFEKTIGVDDAILMPWYYDNYKKEHYTLISERFGADHKYIKEGYTYVEEVPYHTQLREKPCQLAGRGYTFIPTCSTWSKSPWNTVETLEYYLENLPSLEQFGGIMTSTWKFPGWDCKQDHDDALRMLKEAREKLGM